MADKDPDAFIDELWGYAHALEMREQIAELLARDRETRSPFLWRRRFETGGASLRGDLVGVRAIHTGEPHDVGRGAHELANQARFALNRVTALAPGPGPAIWAAAQGRLLTAEDSRLGSNSPARSSTG